MFILLIVLCFVQLFAIFVVRGDFRDVRESFLKAMITLAALIVFSTELLSVFVLLKLEWILGFWIAVNLALGTFFVNLSRKSEFRKGVSAIWAKLLDSFKPPANAILYLVLFIISSTVLLIALVAPPNTADSIAYHLPRVAHWVQNATVDFYPTSITRQLFNGPYIGYGVAHLQILAGSDRFANLVQFLSFITCALAVSLLAREFGLNAKFQLLSAVLFAALPMAILQGSGSQTDMTVSVFIVLFFYFYYLGAHSGSTTDFVFAGIALGVALLSKGNAFLFCFPVGLFIFVFGFFRKSSPRFAFAASTALVLSLAIFLNFGHFARNYQTFGNPVMGEPRLKTERITAPIVFSNLVRNYVVHFGTSYEPISQPFERGVRWLLGDEILNPQSTLEAQTFAIPFTNNEDSAGNPVHLLLLTAAIFLVFISFRKRKPIELITVASIVVGFVLFCVLLKWNVWVSRIHLPLFCLGIPLIAVFLSTLRPYKTVILTAIFVLLVPGPLFLGIPRPVYEKDGKSIFSVPRYTQYFTSNAWTEPLYTEPLEILKKEQLTEVGLDLSVDYANYKTGDWEYIIWLQLKKNFAEPPIIRHVGVTNESNARRKDYEMPDWVISSNDANTIEGIEYEEVWNKQPLRLLKRKR
jgi:4-amino-4-deoxy-L-arabinose transferase-like glycosyltransferase